MWAITLSSVEPKTTQTEVIAESKIGIAKFLFACTA